MMKVSMRAGFGEASRVWLCSALVLSVVTLGCVTTTTPGSGPAPPRQRARAQLDLGLDHLSLGNTAMAIREIQKADGFLPDNPEILLWLGEGYRRKGRLDEARGYMERALVLNPSSHLVLLNLSGVYIQLELYQEAIELTNTLMLDATYPTPWHALNNRGWAEMQSDLLDAAEASFDESLDFHPRYWPTRLNMGILASLRGQKRQAVDHFNMVLDRTPDSFATAEVNYRIGEVYVSWGHRDRAIGYFQTAVVESPHTRWGKKSKDYLELLQ